MKSIAIPPLKKKPLLLWTERVLLVVALCCLGSWAYAWIDSAYYQYRENQILDESLSQQQSSEAPPAQQPPAADTDSLDRFQPPPAAEPPRKPLEAGALVGRIEIPRLGISTIVLEGDDTTTLRRGVGHIPDTAPPGTSGNVGLAAHRDTFFRGLKDIRKNDIIRLRTLDGSYQYRVEWTEIVDPEDTQVLADTGLPELTLVTCYPFYYVGSAPNRFIVHAQRVEDGATAIAP